MVFFSNLHKFFYREGGPWEYVLAGDFKFMENFELGRSGERTSKDCLMGGGDTQMRDLKVRFNLCDSFCRLIPSLKKFTHYSSRYKCKSRIDRIYLSPNLLSQLCKTDMLIYQASDHDAAWAAKDLNQQQRGPGTWKFNACFITQGRGEVNGLFCESRMEKGKRKAD